MADFKSSFMGGYKKKAVDAYIEELENKNKELENNAKLNNQRLAKANKILKEYKTLKDEYEKLQGENAALESEAEKLTNIIENLEASLDKSTKQNNDHIANIGKIFYSAYESGSEITQRAKNGTDEFLAEIGKSSDTARAEIEKAISAYSLINTDVKALLESITKNLTAVSENTDKLIEKASGVASSMKKIDVLKAENEKNAENVIKKYDEFFKEYESEKASEAASEPTYEPTVIKTVSEPANEMLNEPVPVEKIIEEKERQPKIIESAPVQEVKPVESAPVFEQRKQVSVQRQPIQKPVQEPEQKQPEQRRAVDVIRQQMNAQRSVTPKENPQPKKAEENTPMSQNRAVMLKEVLKKFQNNESNE